LQGPQGSGEKLGLGYNTVKVCNSNSTALNGIGEFQAKKSRLC